MATLAHRFGIAEKMLASFGLDNWPAATLVTGDLSNNKHQLLLKTMGDILFQAQHQEHYSRDSLAELLVADDYADFYYFAPGPIAIGSEKKNTRGTVRNLLQHFLPYAPRSGKVRFVYFADASQIRNEAESALLKSLEEPKDHTRFILSAASTDKLKDTIISRSTVVPFIEAISSDKVSTEPWARFWYLSSYEGSHYHQMMQEADFEPILKEVYENLVFNQKDLLAFDQLNPNKLRSHFKKISQEDLAGILRLSFMPLYYSLRDCLLEGSAATEGPIRLALEDKEKALRLVRLVETFFSNLEKRYFGTRPPNFNAVFFSFLSKLMQIW